MPMPSSPNPIFNRKVLKNAVERLDLSTIPDIEQKQQFLEQWKQAIESGKLKGAGEVSLHGAFVNDIFSSVLGYARMTDHPTDWNLVQEQKTAFDTTKADAALGFFTKDDSDTRVVIELKSAASDLDAKQHRKNDKRSAVEQAFSYAPKSGKHCDWIIVSSYLELRLYHKSLMSEYESFRIADLDKDGEFKRFYTLLACENLISKTGESVVDALYCKSEEEEKNISKRFYTEYTRARGHLFEHLKQQNGEVDELLLLEKTQKLLDRFIFVCFCEDTGMLPERIFRKVVKHAQESFAFSDDKVWTELKGLFMAIDRGSATHRIHAFNGELFKPDPALDALHVGDEIFNELAGITDYDFDSDLNVNILGHIFEQSITDLEELRAAIRGEQLDRKQGKRKKEGVFYTPEYITRYSVEQAVGGWLEERRQELGFGTLSELTPDDYASIKLSKAGFKGNKRIEQHRKFWESYKDQLMSIAMLDPACGSGAFLNQAFDFLYHEGQRVNQALADLSLGQSTVFDLNRHILSNNLYGVDLNRESVEITKLSLWLKTANRGSQLTALDDNIKCGNSLIDDPLVAGDKAFKWEEAFSAIMQRGGFDVVIGNPPYVQSRAMPAAHKDYFYSKYQTAEYQLNTFGLFVEKSLNLLKNEAFYSLIIPNYWLSTQYDEKLRTFVFLRYRMIEVLNVFKVFESASVDTVVISGKKSEENVFPKHTWIRSIRSNLKSIEERLLAVSSAQWTFEEKIEFTDRNSETKVSFDKQLKLHGKYQLSDFVDLKKGMQPYEKGKGTPSQTREMMKAQVYHATAKLDDSYLPLLRARSIRRYLLLWENDWIKYGENLAAPRSKDIFEGERVLIRRIISKENIEGTFLSETYINNTDLINIVPRQNLVSLPLKVLTAIILSRLCAYVLKQENVNLNRETFPKINVGTLKSFPIPDIAQKQQTFLIGHVDTMLEINKQFHEGAQKFLHFIEASCQPKKLSKKIQAFYTLEFGEFVKELKKQKVKLNKQDEFELLDLFETQKKQALGWQQKIEQTDREIDRMVYELYGLSEDEIRIVEGK